MTLAARFHGLMRKQGARHQLVRYIVGGVSTASIFWLVLVILIGVFSVHYFISNIIATAFVYLYSYLINKNYVFQDTRTKHVVIGSRFVVMRILLFVLANATLVAGVEVLDIYYIYMFVYIAVQDALISFLIMKFFLFEPESDTSLR